MDGHKHSDNNYPLNEGTMFITLVPNVFDNVFIFVGITTLRNSIIKG